MIAAIYARKLTERAGVADQQKSVARQVEHARLYADRKGWTISETHVYVDDAISGAEFKNRPGLIRLMLAVDDGRRIDGACPSPKPSRDVADASRGCRQERDRLEATRDAHARSFRADT